MHQPNDGDTPTPTGTAPHLSREEAISREARAAREQVLERQRAEREAKEVQDDRKRRASAERVGPRNPSSGERVSEEAEPPVVQLAKLLERVTALEAGLDGKVESAISAARDRTRGAWERHIRRVVREEIGAVTKAVDEAHEFARRMDERHPNSEAIMRAVKGVAREVATAYIADRVDDAVDDALRNRDDVVVRKPVQGEDNHTPEREWGGEVRTRTEGPSLRQVLVSEHRREEARKVAGDLAEETMQDLIDTCEDEWTRLKTEGGFTFRITIKKTQQEN